MEENKKIERLKEIVKGKDIDPKLRESLKNRIKTLEKGKEVLK